LYEVLINLSKNVSSLENNEIYGLEQKLKDLAFDLSTGKRVLTDFKRVKAKICKLQLKRLRGIKIRAHADNLDRSNQVDAAFFEKLKENHKKTTLNL